MKAFLLPLAVLASSAAAQTTSACAANYIVETCLGTENSKLAACGNQDYDCKCTQWKNIITCYNNCPNDPRLNDAVGQREIFCGYATQFPSTTLQTAATSAAQTAPAQTTQGAAATNQNAATGTSSSGSPSATSTGSNATKTNSAAYLALNAGGVLAAVAGVVAVVL